MIDMREFTTTVRYIWNVGDLESSGTVFPWVAARHAQIKLRAYDLTADLTPRVRYLERCAQFEVEFTVRRFGNFPTSDLIEACGELVLRNVAPWASREVVWRIETETRANHRASTVPSRDVLACVPPGVRW